MEDRKDKSYEKRREQIRNAQRTHRTRKATYIKALEKEVADLRRLTGELTDQTTSQKVIINRLHAVLSSRGLAIPPDCVLPESSVRLATINFVGQPITRQSLHVRLPVSSVSTGHASDQEVSPTTVAPQSQPHDPTLKQEHDASEKLSIDDLTPAPVAVPNSTNRIRYAHAQGIDSAQVGINFVLALEQPCLLHHNVQAPMLLLKGQLGTGHEDMLSSPIMKKQPAFSLNPLHLGFPKQDQWTVPAKELETLLRCAPDLDSTGETTPVKAWHAIVGSSKFDLVTFAQLEQLKDILLPLVKCYGFGAVIDQLALEDALAHFFDTL